MAEMIQTEKSGNKRTAVKKMTIDMTPLVDLGFLLITFFIFTTSMIEPKALKLTMPVGEVEDMPIGASNAITVLAGGGDTLYYYEGLWEPGAVHRTTYHVQTGVGNIIRKKQKAMGKDKGKLMLIIKPSDKATYANLVNLLDEAAINDIKKYAVVALSEAEKSFLQH